MRLPLPLAIITRLPDDLSHTLALLTNLLYHEGTLSHSLEALATTAATRRRRSTWLGSCALTGAADGRARELHGLLDAIDRVHELNLEVDNGVLAFDLVARAPPPLSLALISEHILEFVEYISEWLSLASSLLELVLEPVKASAEAALERRSAAKRSLPSERILSLFVGIHPRVIIHATF